MTTKETLHHLIDELPETSLAEVEDFLEHLRSDGNAELPTVLRDAPWDDEPVDPEEDEGDREASEDVRAGRVVSHEEARQPRMTAPPSGRTAPATAQGKSGGLETTWYAT